MDIDPPIRLSHGKRAKQPILAGLVGVCALSLLVLSGCGARNNDNGQANSGSGGGDALGGTQTGQAPASCDITDMRSWVYDNMKDYYLFYDQVDNNVNLSEYNNVETLIKDLRVGPYDQFSYITDEASHNARFDEGETFGFGWNLLRTSEDEFYFRLVEPGSPLALAGAVRGDRLLSINGVVMADFLNQSSDWRQTTLGEGDTVVTIDLGIGKLSGGTATYSVTKATYGLKTVLDSTVLENNGVRTAYLSFYQFLNTSSDELTAVFADFAAQNVNELVLDLRYNGGGRVSVASELASFIVGRDHADEVFATYRPNDKYLQYSTSISFLDKTNALGLDRVFVLQGENTCSASELVVNGLRPFMEVITIGDTSCGKPYATYPYPACGKVMNALELELLNANGVGGYFDGIAADCSGMDNLSQALGDPAENLLSAALDYIHSGSCNIAATKSSSRSLSLALPEQLKPLGLGSLLDAPGR